MYPGDCNILMKNTRLCPCPLSTVQLCVPLTSTYTPRHIEATMPSRDEKAKELEAQPEKLMGHNNPSIKMVCNGVLNGLSPLGSHQLTSELGGLLTR